MFTPPPRTPRAKLVCRTGVERRVVVQGVFVRFLVFVHVHCCVARASGLVQVSRQRSYYNQGSDSEEIDFDVCQS